MAGQQREFLIVIEDRRAGIGAVIGQPQTLRQFLMVAGFPRQGGVFGADDGKGLGIGGAAVARKGHGKAEGFARHVGDKAHGGGVNPGYQLFQPGADGAALLLIQHQNMKIRSLSLTLRQQPHRMARRARHV